MYKTQSAFPRGTEVNKFLIFVEAGKCIYIQQMKKASLVAMSIFYLLAGINHFRSPESYYKIIPPYFPAHPFINGFSGLAEISLAILLLIPQTRRYACYLVIAMLIAFIPAHIYMLKVGFCVNTMCLPQWAIWGRLLVLQPLLIWWAWTNRE
ncbi:DoxX family protein [soil metagenome]